MASTGKMMRGESAILSLICALLVIGIIVIATEASGMSPHPKPADHSCLGREDFSLTYTGEQYRKARPRSDSAPGTVFDAREAYWPGYGPTGEYLQWPVTLRGDYADACWKGGHIVGAWDDTDPVNTWEDPYHHAAGFTFDVPSFTVAGLTITGHGDGIAANGENGRIERVYMTDIHDDCVQNDQLQTLVVTGSLLDGCYVAFSARATRGDDADGFGNRWRIINSLVRLQSQPTPYKPEKYGQAGHGGFFKTEEKAPRFHIYNTVFMAEQDANHGTIGIPGDMKIETCFGNTMVWLGEGDFPGELPACFTITTDREVWDRAVDRWHDDNTTSEY